MKICRNNLFIFLFLGFAAGAYSQAHKPFSVADIEELLRAGVTHRRVATLIEERGVPFEVTKAIRDKLKKAGADERVIQAVNRASVQYARKQLEEEKRRFEEQKRKAEEERQRIEEARRKEEERRRAEEERRRIEETRRRAKRKATVSISPAVVPYKRRVKVRISGSGFEPNKEVRLITLMGGVLSDISFLVKPRPVTDESGGFSVVWTLNREIRRKLIKSTTILVMDEDANTIGTEPLVFEGKSRRRNEERRWINEFVEAVREGRVIRFIVGYAPGGGYDTYTRVVARHISRYIPGNPTMFVQNMTGGGSLIAANYTYNRAKPDGLTVGVWNSGIILQQVLGKKKVKFKADKFGWVGAPVKGWPTCAIMGHTGLKTLKDVVNSNQRIKVGATRAGSTTYDLPKILNKTLGTKFDVISGYTGTFTIRRAMQKQEVDAACWGWESMSVTARAMLDADGDDQLIPFLTQGDAGDSELAHLPKVTDVIKGESNLATFKAWAAKYEFQRPLSLPPGTPKDRLKILRKAFKATLQDRRFLADARRSHLIINYVSGEQIERYVDQILMAPPKAKENLRFLVRRKN